MFENIKARITKLAVRTSFAANAVIFGLILLAYVGTHTGHVRGQVDIVGWQWGGGTEEHAEREQQLAALASALPINIADPAHAAEPTHKPKVPK